MGEQVAGLSVVEELLRNHRTTPPRNAIGRLFGFSPLADDSVSWYLGALGEIAVGKILAALPPEWTAFHAIPIGTKGSDIDHIVIGPGGIFTLNTKHHRRKAVWVAGRTLMVSGQKLPHIRNAEYEAKRVTKMLRERMPLLPAVQATIVVVNPKSLTIKTKPELVKVVADTGLRRWLISRPVVLDSIQLIELGALIDDPATWPTPAFPPTENPMALFAALHAEVRTAHFRNTAWRLFGILAGTTTAVLVGPSLMVAVMSALIGGSVSP